MCRSIARMRNLRLWTMRNALVGLLLLPLLGSWLLTAEAVERLPRVAPAPAGSRPTSPLYPVQQATATVASHSQSSPGAPSSLGQPEDIKVPALQLRPKPMPTARLWETMEFTRSICRPR